MVRLELWGRSLTGGVAQKWQGKAAAVKVLGAAGLGFSLVGSASASTMPTAGIPQSDNTSPNQRFVLSDEEMTDVSLATFYKAKTTR